METYPIFFTATIKDWKYLLKKDRYKDIILESLAFLTQKKRVKIYGFVLMPNHIHLIWEVLEGHRLSKVQRDFLKYTSQQIKFVLAKYHPAVLKEFEVNVKDRKYRFWKDRSLSVSLYNDEIFMQKLNYIYDNLTQAHWNLSNSPEDYKYSSANFYYKQDSTFDFLTHFSD